MYPVRMDVDLRIVALSDPVLRRFREARPATFQSIRQVNRRTDCRFRGRRREGYEITSRQAPRTLPRPRFNAFLGAPSALMRAAVVKAQAKISVSNFGQAKRL
jgi:hypothetical protein